MSVFSDRRTFRQIGGFAAYVRQVVWSVWWRMELRRRAPALQAIPLSALRGAGDDRLNRPAA